MNTTSYAPVVLFTFNRVDKVRLTVQALQANTLAPQSDLYVFSDNARHDGDRVKVGAVREFLRTIDGFRSVTIVEREVNFGLARSIIEGASAILERHGRIIVLEDDIVTSTNFLCYMNGALDFYANTHDVFAVSGHTIALESLKSWHKDTYVALRPASWGWATWRSQWEGIDWQVSDYGEFIRNRKAKQQFNLGGADLTRMLKHYMEGKNNSWAIRWAYAMHKAGKYAIYPRISKVSNIGFGDGATHCSGVNIYHSDLDASTLCQFNFLNDLRPEQRILDEFRSQYTFVSKLRKKAFETLRKLAGKGN